VRISPEIRKVCLLSALLWAWLAPAREAHAFERQWHVGIDGGYAVIFDPGVSGFGGGAHAAYGISDSFNAMLELALTRHPDAALTLGTGDNAKTLSVETVASGAAGIAYTIDIARAVPYVGVLAAGYRLGDVSSFSPGGQLALGLDYQLERNWAIGAQIRLHTIFTADAGTIAYGTTFLRLEYLWGF
jgi:outer membrane protein with beta-barrel domain